VARRPSDVWRQDVEEQAAELAAGLLDPDDAYAAHLWPDDLIAGTDAALAAFEAELGALAAPSDREVLDVVRRAVLALNEVHHRVGEAGLTPYETEERNQLARYIDDSLAEAGIDVAALAARNGFTDGDVTSGRDW
jgi:hypothetical protein